MTTQLSNEKSLRLWATGYRPLLFARPPIDVKAEAKQPVRDKFELNEDGAVIIRDTRLKSGLHTDFSKKMCVTRIHYKGSERGKFGSLMWGCLQFNPTEIVLTRAGQPIVFSDWGQNGISKHGAMAYGKGVPVWVERPMIELPWGFEVDLHIIETEEYKIDAIMTDLVRLGNIGIGSFNASYGKCRVAFE